MKRNIILVATVMLGLVGVWCYGAMHQQIERMENQTFAVSPEIVAKALRADQPPARTDGVLRDAPEHDGFEVY